MFALLNVLDGVVSYLGYVSGYMIEMNPFMNSLLFTHPLSFLFLKIWISAIMFGVGMFSYKFEEVKFLSVLFLWLLRVIIFVYILIMVIHARWIIQVFF